MKKLIIISLFLGLLTAYNCSAETNTAPASDTIKTDSTSQLAAPTNSATPAAATTTIKYCITLIGGRATCYFDANHIERYTAPNGIELCVPGTCQ